MATVQVTLPVGYHDSVVFEKEVSSLISSGYDVQFVDSDGNEQNIVYIGLFGGSDGAVKSRLSTQVGAEAQTKTLVSGGYTKCPASYIFASGTGAGLGINVRLYLP